MDPSEEEDVAQPKEEITDDEDGGDVTKKEVLGTEENEDYERKLELLRVQLYHEKRKVKEGENADQVQKLELVALNGRLENLETELGSIRLKVSHQDEIVQSLKDKTECPVCWEIPRTAPVPVCPNGHIVCSRCRRATCPTCRASMGAGKSLLAATIIEKVEHVCSFDNCNQFFPLGEIENHEATCAHRKICCVEDTGAQDLYDIDDLEEIIPTRILSDIQRRLVVLAGQEDHRHSTEEIRPLEELRPLPGGPNSGNIRAAGRIPGPGPRPFVAIEELRPFPVVRMFPPTSPSRLRMVIIGGAEQNLGIEYRMRRVQELRDRHREREEMSQRLRRVRGIETEGMEWRNQHLVEELIQREQRNLHRAEGGDEPGEERLTSEPEEDMESLETMDEIVETRAEWDCSSCTFHNVAGSSVCEMCNSSSPPLGITCSRCTLVNLFRARTCPACDFTFPMA